MLQDWSNRLYFYIFWLLLLLLLGSLTNFYWGHSGLHWNPVPAWGHSPARGWSMSWFNRTGPWTSWRNPGGNIGESAWGAPPHQQLPIKVNTAGWETFPPSRHFSFWSMSLLGCHFTQDSFWVMESLLGCRTVLALLQICVRDQFHKAAEPWRLLWANVSGHREVYPKPQIFFHRKV